MLPERYADLERFIGWAQPTFEDRTRKCSEVTMEEAHAFYDAVFPRVEEIIAYLNDFPLEALPPAEQRVAYMVYALVHISLAVEIYDQIELPDASRSRLPMWPAVSGDW